MQDRRTDLAANSTDPQIIATAFDKALDILGPPSKKALLFHLQNHSISLDDNNNPHTLEQLYLAMQSMLGFGGAGLLMEIILLKMDELLSDAGQDLNIVP